MMPKTRTQRTYLPLRVDCKPNCGRYEENAPGAPIERDLVILDRVAEALGA